MQSDLDDYSSEAKSNMRARAIRVRKFIGYVHTNGIEFDRKTLIARFSTENGVARSTVYEYASQLVDGGYLVIHKEHILSLEDYEKQMTSRRSDDV